LNGNRAAIQRRVKLDISKVWAHFSVSNERTTPVIVILFTGENPRAHAAQHKPQKALPICSGGIACGQSVNWNFLRSRFIALPAIDTAFWHPQSLGSKEGGMRQGIDV